MLNKECDKNFNEYTYGGYECGDDGKWSNICKPFYCDQNYYFDYVNQKCVKDIIAEKDYTAEYEIIEEDSKDEDSKEEDSKDEDSKDEDSKDESKSESDSEKIIKISRIIFILLFILF